MSHIKSKDTSIELMVRRYLFAMGYTATESITRNYRASPTLCLQRRKLRFSFMDAIGMDMIAEAAMHIPVSRIRHTGSPKLSGQNSEIKSI